MAAERRARHEVLHVLHHSWIGHAKRQAFQMPHVTTLHLRLGGPAQSEVSLETAAAVHDAAHVLQDRDRRRPATFFDILSSWLA
jgi:hypothetical protein